jgi:proteasome lid subunit RPN8/RPN11
MLTDNLRAAITEHARRVYPRECCGLVIRGRYFPVPNVSATPCEAFSISPSDWTAMEDLGEIEAVVHSHPDGRPFPSAADFDAQAATGLLWVIVALGPEHVDGWYAFGA